MPKIVDHNQRRTEITWALWQVVSERGIEGVTFQAVAQAARISVGRIQHYFSSKDELVLAGCRAIVDLSTAAYEERVRSLDPWEALTELVIQPIPQTKEFRLGAAVWYAYIARAVVDPAIGEIVQAATRGTQDEAESLLRAAGSRSAYAARLVSLSAGLTQRVLIGAMTPEDAVAILKTEVEALRSDTGTNEQTADHEFVDV